MNNATLPNLLILLVAALAIRASASAGSPPLEKPIDPRSDLQRSLYDAISHRDAEKVGALLDNGADPNGPAIQKICDTPLMTAVMLSSRDRDRNEVPEKVTARFKVCEQLLNHKADPNGPGCRSLSVFIMSILFTNDPDLVSLMIDHGADLMPWDGVPALNAAINAGKPEMVRLLIRRGADVNFFHEDEPGPLDLALRRRKWKGENAEEIIKILQAAGAVEAPVKKKPKDAAAPK